jgi:peptidoglycan/LPS O-acetylase OafA/YrhL
MARVGTLRWLAAFVVVVYHVRFLLFAAYGRVEHKDVLLRVFYFFTSLGQEAFVVYMVLSGMLLGGQSYKRWQRNAATARADLWRKFQSLYLVLVPVLLAGGLLDVFGSRMFAASGIYAFLPEFAVSHLRPAALAGNLLMLQDIAVPGFGSNAMLFLLAFECWAYLVFAAFVLLGRTERVRGAAAATMVAAAVTFFAPKFFGYLLAWLLGLAVSTWGPRLRGKAAPRLGALCFFAAVLVSRFCGARVGAMPPDLILAARLLLDSLVALGLALFLLSLYGRQVRRRRTALPGRLQRTLGRLSLFLYAGHFPFMMFVAAGSNVLLAWPLHAQPSAAGFLRFALVVGAIYLFAMLLAWLAAALRSLLHKVHAPPARYSAP